MMTAQADSWLLHTVVGGGLLLLATRLLQSRVRIPVRSQRLGEWGLAAALLLAVLSCLPAWIPLPVLSSRSTPSVAVRDEESQEQSAEEMRDPGLPGSPLFARPSEEPLRSGAESSPSTLDHQHRGADAAPLAGERPGVSRPVQPETQTTGARGDNPHSAAWISWIVPGLLAGYGLVAAGLLLRWLLGRLALAWLVYRGRSGAQFAPLLERLRQTAGNRIRPRLVVSSRVRVPFSFGLWRPTIVLPESLVSSGDEQTLLWVLEHEWTHLERQDARSTLLFQVGQLVYFYLPWFWSVWRQVRLSQEYLADAAAARVNSSVADYASFLVQWTRRAAPPVGTTGVSGSTSDLFRRIAMLVNPSTPLETKCPRRWSLGLGCGLLASAVVLAGLGWTARAEEPKKAEPDGPRTEKKADQKKEAEKPAPARPDFVFPDPDKVFPRLEGRELPKDFEQRMEEARKEMQRVREEMQRTLRALEAARQPLLPMGPMGPMGLRFPDGVTRIIDGTRLTAEPRLGARLTKPSASLADQLDLPRDQGYVLDEVGPNSPAAKAGLKQYDILLELNGQPISNKDGDLAKVLKEIKPDQPVEAIVLRKGRKETVKGLKLPEVKVEQPANPFGVPRGAFPAFPGGAGGAGVSGIISTKRANDEFVTRNQAGDLDITIKGKIDQGKARVQQVRIKSGGQETTYDSVDKVPAEYKEKVQKLVEMSAQGGVRLELRVP
jgi:beta-lactamase regulating signal transducer with metallopeptidase domain